MNFVFLLSLLPVLFSNVPTVKPANSITALCKEMLTQYKVPSRKELKQCSSVLKAYKKHYPRKFGYKVQQYRSTLLRCMQDACRKALALNKSNKKKPNISCKMRFNKANKLVMKRKTRQLLKVSKALEVCTSPKTKTFQMFWSDVFKLFEKERKINEQRLKAPSRIIPFIR